MRRCKPQKLFGEIEQEAQPSADAYINKEQYEVMDGERFTLPVLVVITQPDRRLSVSSWSA
jgi:hypothetical protein